MPKKSKPVTEREYNLRPSIIAYFVSQIIYQRAMAARAERMVKEDAALRKQLAAQN